MNFMGKREELVTTGITWSETRLMFTNKIVFIRKLYTFLNTMRSKILLKIGRRDIGL